MITSDMPYNELDGIETDTEPDVQRPSHSQIDLPPWIIKNSRILKALAQCQVVTGLVTLALAVLYTQGGAFSLFPLGVFIGCYYVITGLIGICGSASFRRGLTICYMVMCLHVIVICIPIVTSFYALALYYDGGECKLFCDLQKISCTLQCESSPTWKWASNRAGQSIDIGLIALSFVKLILTVACTVICCINMCERFSYLDEETLFKVVKHTLYKRPVAEENTEETEPTHENIMHERY